MSQMMKTQQVIQFVEDPTVEKAEDMLNMLKEHKDLNFVMASMKLCSARNIHFHTDHYPVYNEIGVVNGVNLLAVMAFCTSDILAYFPEHIVNPERSVRFELTRQWYNANAHFRDDIPKRWKDEEEMLYVPQKH